MQVIDNTTEFKSGSPITGTELLIGSGNNHTKQVALRDRPVEWQDLVTLDMNRDCKPDVTWDLMHIPYPIEDNTFEEIHAYDVLEHLWPQGDYKSFFNIFTEFHRILKPDGFVIATVPMWDSVWAWGDPGHRNVINAGTISFLDQDVYERDIGNTAMMDYRDIYKVSFSIEHAEEKGERFVFVLQAR